MSSSLPGTLMLPLPSALDLKVTVAIAGDPNLKVALTLVLAKAVLNLKVTLIFCHGHLPVLQAHMHFPHTDLQAGHTEQQEQ